MNNLMPLVTIIINNYNYSQFIAEALQSVLGQSYPHKEIIVVDDGSTDKSVNIVRSYQKRYSGQINLIKKTNGGQASAMNAGFESSKGEIICFLDSDDYWFGNKIEEIVKLHKKSDFVQHNLLLRGGRYRLLLNTESLSYYLKEYGLIRSCVPTSAQSFSRKLLEKLFPMPEHEMRLCADVWLRCGALYYSDVSSTDDCLGVYRLHGDNGWQDNLSKERPNIAMELIELFNRRLEKQGLKTIPIRSDSRERSFMDSINIQKGGRYILYGSDHIGRKVARKVKEKGGMPIFFVDNDSKLYGTRKDGLLILPKKAIHSWRPFVDKIVVSDLFVENIYEELTDMGLSYPEDIILPIDIQGHTVETEKSIQNEIDYENLEYFCPVCRLDLSKWKPFVRRVGENRWREEPGGRLCPFCNSFERTRHFVLYLDKNDIFKNETTFLHVAPEPGLQLILRTMLGKKYTSIDMKASDDVDISADLTKLPFLEGVYNFIYCSNVLEHIPDDISAMRELFRVLTPGGTAYIQVPISGEITQEDLTITDPAERNKLYGQADHVRQYGTDIKKRLEAVGFEVKECLMPDYLDLPIEIQKKYNCSKKEMIHLCRK